MILRVLWRPGLVIWLGSRGNIKTCNVYKIKGRQHPDIDMFNSESIKVVGRKCLVFENPTDTSFLPPTQRFYALKAVGNFRQFVLPFGTGF